MSSREIGQLSPVPTLDTTALFEIEQGGNSFRTDLADMLALQLHNLSNLIIDANKDWLGFDITNLGNLGVTGFVDLAEIPAPANPAVNTGRLYSQDVAGTTSLFFRDNAGVATNLLLGVETLTWTANHNANGFALEQPRFADVADPSKIVFVDLSGMTTGVILTVDYLQTTSQTLQVPDVGGGDFFVTEDVVQTLSNKTLLVPIIADFSNATHNHETAAAGGQLDSTLALLDTATIAYLNTPNVYVAGNRQDFLGDTGGTSGLNVGGIAGNPNTQVDGDLWLNTATNQIFARINGVDIDLSNTGVAPPFDDNAALVQNQGDNTKLLRFDVSGNTTLIEGVIATIFTTAKTITIPDATDTLVGKATADFFTNKTFDVDATGNALVQATPTAGQYLRDDGAEFIGSAIQDVDLPAVVVRTNIANTFGDFAQSFADDQLLIRNPADSFSYKIIADAIIADRSVTLPLLLGNDIFVTEAFIQTLTNKSLGTGTSWTAIPTITDGLKITFNPNNTNAGLNAGQNTDEPSAPVNGDIFYDSTVGFLKGRNNGVWEQLGGEIFTWSADHSAAGFDLLNVGGITINNPADTFEYIITPDAIAADRIVNLPLLIATDTLVMEAHIQTLSNKTIDSTVNTITIVKADISDFPILAADIADNNVTFTKLSDISANEVIGRVAGGTGDPDALTATELTTIPNLFTPTLKGQVPQSGGGVVNFLRADATWAIPAGGGGGDMVLADIQTVTGAKTFVNEALILQNPAGTVDYIFEGSAIVADRNVILPLLTGNDTFVMVSHTQTLTSKSIDLANNTLTGTFAEFNTAVSDATLVDLDDVQTLTNKTINSISNTITITKSDISDFPIVTADITDNNVTFAKLQDIATQTFIGRTTAGSGDPEELTATQATAILNVFTDTLKGLVPLSGGGTTNFLRADGTFAVPTGGVGDMILAAVQTVTGAKTFADDAFLIQNPAITFAYLFQGGAIVADRTINLPVLAGNDTLAFEAHAQTLTNKTIDAATNTITNIGSPEVIPDIITGQTALGALAVDDELLIHDTSGAVLRRIDVSELVQSLLITNYDQEDAGDNNFFVVSGGPFSGDTLELDAQAPVASDSLFQKLGVHVATSGQGDAWNWTLRINGADGNSTISIPASATGFFQDVSNTDAVSAGDLICYQSTSVDGGGLTLTGATMVVTII